MEKFKLRYLVVIPVTVFAVAFSARANAAYMFMWSPGADRAPEDCTYAPLPFEEVESIFQGQGFRQIEQRNDVNNNVFARILKSSTGARVTITVTADKCSIMNKEAISIWNKQRNK